VSGLLAKPAFRVWLFLAAATVLSWWLGADHGLGSGEAVIAVVLVIAFVKAWFVGQWFMELRTAPASLNAWFYAWLVACATAVVVLYLAG